PYPLPAAIQNVYDLDVGKDPAMKDIGPMEPWDLHYLRAIDDNGFIDNLYMSEESSHRLYRYSIVGCRNGFSALWSRNKGGGCYGTQKLSFQNGGEIPRKYTCDANDVSPSLSWLNAPAGTRAFVLIADDPDAPSGTWVHWVLYDLPAEMKELPEGTATTETLPNGAKQGANDFRKVGYG